MGTPARTLVAEVRQAGDLVKVVRGLHRLPEVVQVRDRRLDRLVQRVMGGGFATPFKKETQIYLNLKF